MAERLESLRRLGDEELIRKHDEAAKTQSEGIREYRDELARRDAQRQGDRIEAMTHTMVRLTWAIAAFTLVVTVATVVTLLVMVTRP